MQSQSYNQAKEAQEAASRERHFIAEIDPRVDKEVDGAMAMAERGRLREAERIMTGLCESRPDLHIVQFGMGVVRALQKRTAEALGHFDRAVTIYPYFVEAWFNKAMAHQEMLDVKPMVVAYRKVLDLSDSADEPAKHAADMLATVERQVRDETELSLDRYLELMDVFEGAFAAMERREWERALSGFREVVAANPKHAQSFGNMGLCHAFLGRKSEALAALDRALEIDPSYGLARMNRQKVAALNEGEPMDAEFISQDYFRDRVLKRGRSGRTG